MTPEEVAKATAEMVALGNTINGAKSDHTKALLAVWFYGANPSKWLVHQTPVQVAEAIVVLESKLLGRGQPWT